MMGLPALVAACTSSSPEPSAGDAIEGTASPETASVRIEPTGDHVNGQRISVSASGLPPGEKLTTSQCLANPGAMASMWACEFSRAKPFDADEEGNASGSFVLRVNMARGVPVETNCAVAGCVIAVTDADEEVVAAVPITWARDVQAPPAPELKVDVVAESFQKRDDGQFVKARLTGTEFVPGEKVRLSQCPTPRTDKTASKGDDIRVAGGDCLYGYGAEARADADGRFSAQMEIAVLFQRSNGELIDCRESNPPCLIARTTVPKNPDSRLVVQPVRLPRDLGR